MAKLLSGGIRRLDTLAGNNTIITVADVEPLRQQLAALPRVNYGTFAKDALSGADGLKDYGTFMRLARKMASGYRNRLNLTSPMIGDPRMRILRTPVMLMPSPT